MLEWTLPFRVEQPEYNGETLDDVIESCLEEGYIVWWSDMRTTLHTARHKIHGVYVIVLLDGNDFILLTGTYNYLSALEGAYSVPLVAEISPAAQSDQRWSLWDNPMRNRKEEAWYKMWKYARSFKSERDLHEYILTYMKGWDDIGSTLWEARCPK